MTVCVDSQSSMRWPPCAAARVQVLFLKTFRLLCSFIQRTWWCCCSNCDIYSRSIATGSEKGAGNKKNLFKATDVGVLWNTAKKKAHQTHERKIKHGSEKPQLQMLRETLRCETRQMILTRFRKWHQELKNPIKSALLTGHRCNSKPTDTTEAPAATQAIPLHQNQLKIITSTADKRRPWS